jgi:P27 family predicted phage terminase small subunit
MRGRKPKPTALRILEGNREKRPISQDEPQPDVGLPPAPDDLKGEALEEWNSRGPRLVALGVLTELDIPAFYAYCDAWGRYQEAKAQIAKLGEVVRSPSGYPIPNPYRAIANRAVKQCKEFWLEFGMTPSSRTRIHVRPGASRASKVDTFMKSKPRRLA